jgi:flagellin
MTAATGSGSLVINGISTAAINVTTDASISRQTVVQAINNISAQTGVTAVDTGDAVHGVQLFAADGRNITIKSTSATGLTAADTGLNLNTTASTTANTYVGTFQLSTPSNSPITLGSAVGGNISNADLTTGTYTANTAQVVSAGRAEVSSTSASSGITDVSSATGILDGSSLKLNGVVVGAAVSTDDTSSDTTAYSSQKSESAFALAAYINKSTNLTGVTAVAEANTIVGSSFTADGTATPLTSLYINGVTINASALGSSYKVSDVANLIDQYTGQTGVVASDNGKGLTLVAADGRNISLGLAAGTALNLGLSSTNLSTAATTAALATTTYGQVALQSNKQFTVESGTTGDANLNNLGFSTGTFGGANNGLKIAAIDVSTQAGAQNAITAIDAALTTVSQNQSRAGAFINRLNDVVANQTSMQTNMTASRSTIEDTDYSQETTNLAKSQIISQAATAMLAQANQSSQNVLALLK